VQHTEIQLFEISAFGVNISTIGTTALIVIMLTMGLKLEIRHFGRILGAPIDVFVGLLCQVLLLPIGAFALIWLFQPPTPVAIGLIILSCCPGGATSNFFSFLARGDIALSIVLTAISGIMVVFTAPLIIALGLDVFTGQGEEIVLPVGPTMLRIFALVVLPTMIGMALRGFNPVVSAQVEPWATRVSFAFILFTMVVLFLNISEHFLSFLAISWQVTVTLNVVMMALGYFLARTLRIQEQQRRTICIEVGVQNYLLSVVIAVALLQQPEFAIVPIVYLFTMYVSVFTFIGWARWSDRHNGSTFSSVDQI